MVEIEVIGAQGGLDRKALYRGLETLGGPVAALEPDMVCGVDHLLTAARHALRAHERGENSSPNLGIETVLYASGERQISRALDKMAPKDGREVALVLFDLDPDDSLRALGMERDDGLLGCTLERMKAFGIGEDEMLFLPPEIREDLVLERVAFVELLKR